MKETVDFSKLISDATSGNSSAFEELYKLSLKTAYHTASLLLKNPNDIEDVLQNTYIKAYQKLPELKNPESFESWIKTIVENECKNHIKKEKRISAPIIFFKNKADEHSEEWNQPVPQEYMEREELRKSVSDILDTLSPEVRTCIILFHYEDKSLNEISEMLDIPLGTVKSRLHNGRKQIEKEFNKLKKKDPSLYSIGAIPVILSLLSYQAKNIVLPATIAEGIITSASSVASTTTAGSTIAGTTAASTAATSGVATTAVASVAVKVVAVAVAGSVAVGGTVAVKNHIDNKITKTTTAYSTTCKTEEACTISENLNEILTTLEESTSLTTSSSPSINITTQTEMQTVTASSAIQTTKSSTQKQTTKVYTTVTEPTTTVKLTNTTKITITTDPSTIVRETTTEERTTAKQTTTNPPTTSPENNYASSGGVITEYKGSDTNVSIPSIIGSSTVTAIGSGAFAGNTEIKSVSLPSSVTQIGQEAFADCTSLTSVYLPSSLELIGMGAFYGCSNLTSASVPNGTKTISDEAFAQCSSLRIITIASSVTSISDDAFDGCNSLTIKCEEGSVAHNFAVANEINYTLV